MSSNETPNLNNDDSIEAMYARTKRFSFFIYIFLYSVNRKNFNPVRKHITVLNVIFIPGHKQ